MEKKVTIRDVAAKAGVSISSVHFALSGKPGVSEETRSKIRQTAELLGYQPNALASSLKRKTQRIAILIPDENGNNQYYYPPVWRGIHDYLSTINMNLEYTGLPFSDENKSEVFQRFFRMTEEKSIDGILTVGHIDGVNREQWKRIHDSGISTVVINSCEKVSDYLCCVQPDYDIIGRTMAEIITGHIPEYGSIFICAGNPNWTAHACIVQAFENYMKENNRFNMIYKDFSWTTEEINYIHIFRELCRPDVAACCSVYSQGTVLLGRALEESRRAGKVFAVGSDLPEDTADRIRRLVINNSIQKNPYAQGYIGARTLVEYLVSGKVPEQKNIFVGSEVVFKSNLPMYEHGRYRYQFF